MTAKGCCLSSKDNQKTFGNEVSDDQYNNIKLINFDNHSSVNTTCSKLISSVDKKLLNCGRNLKQGTFCEGKRETVKFVRSAALTNMLELTDTCKSQTINNSKVWDKSNKDISHLYLQCNSDSAVTKKDGMKGPNGSTLSLHIIAYENSVEIASELNSFDDTNKLKQKSALMEKMGNVKQNSFEFPRQQENDEARVPEIAHFRASQRLLSPNQLAETASTMDISNGKAGEAEEAVESREEQIESMSEALRNFKLLPYGLTEVSPTTDFGIVMESVTSVTKRKYFVIVELKRACVTFVQNDGTSFQYDYFHPGTTVKVIRNAANQVEDVELCDVFDSDGKQVNTDGGFIAKSIFRYDGNGKKEYEVFVGCLKIHNIESSIDDVEDSDDDSSDDTDSDINDEEVVEREDVPHIDTFNIIENAFYERVIVPVVIMDCTHRSDDFYARENIPFIWLPSTYVSNALPGETFKMKDYVSWTIPTNTVSEIFEFPNVPFFRGCFVDNDRIFLAHAPHSLAFYSANGNFGGDRRGRDLAIDRLHFDHHLNSIFVKNAFYERNPVNPAANVPLLFVPTENDLFQCELDDTFGLGHFYRHAYKFCYIYDRYGVIEGYPHQKGTAYPIKINKDFKDGKYLTVVEIAPLPEMGFMPRDDTAEYFHGEGFVATDEIIFCKEYDYIPIHYSKEKFALEPGTFCDVLALYDLAEQRYYLESFRSSTKYEALEPIRGSEKNRDNKIYFHVPVKIQCGFFTNDFFGIISVKPFRKVDRFTTIITVSYVGDDPKYQTPFAENEEYALQDDDDDESDFGY